MKKAEIVNAILEALRERKGGPAVGFEDVQSYERHVAAEVQRRLDSIDPELDFPTCADFANLGVECCPICHSDYPEYELAMVEIESGGRAWLCCALDRALNPAKHAAMEESPDFQELARLFGGMSDSGQ